MSDARLAAVLAGLAAFFGTLTAAADGGLTLVEWLTAITAGLVATAAPVAVPRVRAAQTRRREARAKRDLGRPSR